MRRTLTHIRGTPELEGRIPHVFHRHGALDMDEDYLQFPNKITVKASTEPQKLAAYGYLCAGDAMVPYQSNADLSLSHSLRVAVGTRILKEIGTFETPADFTLNQPFGTVYDKAVFALTQWGTVNENMALRMAKRHMTKEQKNSLQPLIKTMIQAALRHEDLSRWYTRFHDLYGHDTSPEGEPALGYGELWVGSPSGYDDTEAEWGKMEIHKIRMVPWKHPSVRSKKAWKYSEFGIFKYPWRAMPSSDMRCFSLRRWKYGGTVLIDFSSSMQIKQDEVDRVLIAAPYATIAAYSSYGEDEYQEVGNIVVMAENCQKGKASEARKLLGPFNLIDGPALRWLATQEGPRIWISDGLVTGINDVKSEMLLIEAEQICHAGKIIRIPTLKELLKRLNA